MAKKKSAKKKPLKKPTAKKTPGKWHVNPFTGERVFVPQRWPKASPQTQRNTKVPKSSDASKSSSLLKNLASVKAAGAKAVEVHFHGAGDDGWYEYRVIGGKTKHTVQLSPAAENEVNEFLRANYRHYGEGPGSVLLARFDLDHAVCHGYSGSGNPGSRLAELISFCEWHGATKIVGTLRSGEFGSCKVVPASALARKEASDAVRRFLELTREYSVEYSDYDEAEGYDGEEYALLDAADGTLAIDIANRRVTLTQSPASKSIEIAVDRLIETSLPLRLA
jgi:hypothetical protein